jgi:DNA-binding CsgD family transcriptional regulator
MPPSAPLWSPSPERRSRANVTAFLRWLEAHEGLSFEGYDDLWRWSVEELEAFWSAVWRFYDVQAEGRVGPALAERRMPGARWFEGARLNYAEHVLDRAPADGPALVYVAEDTEPVELTAAELRLLPLLSTHLSYAEIGERLYVSKNTVKTQAYSAYRKLGVSSRSEAVVRTRELGLDAL